MTLVKPITNSQRSEVDKIAERLRRRYIESGLIVPDQGTHMSPEQVRKYRNKLIQQEFLVPREARIS